MIGWNTKKKARYNMKSYKWIVKAIKLKEEVETEFEYQALQTISNLILDGKFALEIEKQEGEGNKI